MHFIASLHFPVIAASTFLAASATNLMDGGSSALTDTVLFGSDPIPSAPVQFSLTGAGGLTGGVLLLAFPVYVIAQRLLGDKFRLTLLREEEVNLETAFMRLTKGVVQ